MLSKLLLVTSANLKTDKNKLESNFQLLNSVGPKSILERGYTYLQDEKGKILKSVTSFDQLKKESTVKISFNDGTRDLTKR